MTRSFKKKTRKYRGKRTFGTGKIGTRRAKGQRGGTGLTTGLTKYKWSLYLKQKNLGFPDERYRRGKNGFNRPGKLSRKPEVKAINIKDIELKLDEWVEAGKASVSRNKYTVNLSELGFDKVIGRGKVTKKMDITVESASEGAVEKLKEAKCTIKLAE